MKKLSLVFLLLLSSVLYASGTRFTTNVTEIKGYTKKNELVKITIRTRKISQDDLYYEGLRWGILKGSHAPDSQYVISDCKILIDNKKVLVPLSAYCDLGNPYEVSFESEEDQFTLRIIGGHTATAYEAELVFEQLPNTDYLRNRIRYRKVSLMEASDEVWEKTEYSFIIDDGR